MKIKANIKSEETIEQKLKPCPFCGKPGIEEIENYCSCSNEACNLAAIDIPTEAWNTRAPDEKLEKCLEFVKEVSKFTNEKIEDPFGAMKLLKKIGENYDL